MKVSDSPISSSLFAVYNAPVSCALGFVWAGTAGECAQHLDGLWPAALAAGRLQPPKSGDVTRCVNVVNNLGFPQVCMDNQHEFVDNTML